MEFLEKSGKGRVVTLLARGTLYLCLVVFPLLIVYVELVRFFELETESRRSEFYQIAGNELLKMSEYAEDARFFHLLLKNEFSPDVPSLPQNGQNLKVRVERLKQEYPGLFSFIFWDRNGEVMTSLSDDTRFNFVLKKLNLMLAAIKLDTRAGQHTEAGFAEKYNKDLRMLRQFLGPFITAEGLTRPFLDAGTAGCFQLHARGERTLGWYASTADYSVLVYLSDKVRGALTGPGKLRQGLQGKWPQISFYLFDERELKSLPEAGGTMGSEILLNFGKLKKMAPREHLESKTHFFEFEKLNERWWGVAAIDKAAIGKVEVLAGRFLARTVLAVLILLFISACYFMVHANPLHSVQAKLIGVFAYTIFIPALVFGVVAFDYLQQQKKQGISSVASRSFQLLTSIDSQFNVYMRDRATELASVIERMLAGKSADEINQMAVTFGNTLVDRFAPDTVVLADSSGEDILKAKFSKTLKDARVRQNTVEELITYLNIDPEHLYLPSTGIAEGVLLNFPLNYRRLVNFTLSSTSFVSYLDLLRNQDDGKFTHAIQVFWYEKDLHLEFFRQILGSAVADPKHRLVISIPETGQTWPESEKLPGLAAFIEKVRVHGPSYEEITDGQGRTWLAVGQAGTSLSSAILCVIVDRDLVQGSAGRLKIRIQWLVVWSILVTLSLLHILSHYLIMPVKALATGVEMVKNQNYSYRINMQQADELGRLGHSIDESLENLQELEIAKTVQESLLPQDSLDLDNYFVAARTRSMTSMGGDYYDFIVDSDKNAAILMADVAGHGVQAALIMAMAKSVLLLNDSACSEPEVIMSALNRTFCNLRKSSITTMMTGQIISISSAGAINLLNAGHCPPLFISSGSREITTVCNHALPFGFSPRRKFERLPVNMSAGDIMILYSDGILECANRQGKMLGEEGFAELARNCYDVDCNRYLNKLFDAYDEWVVSQQDDITFVMIKRKDN